MIGLPSVLASKVSNAALVLLILGLLLLVYLLSAASKLSITQLEPLLICTIPFAGALASFNCKTFPVNSKSNIVEGVLKWNTNKEQYNQKSDVS